MLYVLQGLGYGFAAAAQPGPFQTYLISQALAYVNKVPFIAFRSLSDLAGGGPSENEISTFFQLAVDNSAKVVIAFLEKFP